MDLFESSGIATGVDLEALVETAAWVERDLLGSPLPGRVFRARMGMGGPGERTPGVGG